MLGQHRGDPLEDLPVDLLLAPGAILLDRAEVLERAEARDRVKAAEALALQLPRIEQMHVQAVAQAGRRLRARQRDAQPDRLATADEVEQRPPAAAEVQHARASDDPDLLGHVLVLPALSLLQADREVAVVLGAAEVGELPHAQAEHAIGQRVGEVDVAAIGHRNSRQSQRGGATSTQPLPAPRTSEDTRREDRADCSSATQRRAR